MTKDEIFKDLQEIIVDSIGLESDEIENSSDFRDDLGFDSLDSIEVIMEVEKKYYISIPDDEAEKLETVEKAVDYLFNRLN
jgi:acyl carrier protein